MDSSSQQKNGSAVGEILLKMPHLTKTRLPNGELKNDSYYVDELFSLMDEYRLKNIPTTPEFIEDEYYKLDWKHIIEMNKNPDKYPKFWFNPIVKDYFDTRDSIVAGNERNLKVLRWLRHQFINDFDKKEKIDVMIYPFLEFKYPAMNHDGRILMKGLSDIVWPLFSYKITEDYGISQIELALPEIKNVLGKLEYDKNTAIDKQAFDAVERRDSIWEE